MIEFIPEATLILIQAIMKYLRLLGLVFNSQLLLVSKCEILKKTKIFDN